MSLTLSQRIAERRKQRELDEAAHRVLQARLRAQRRDLPASVLVNGAWTTPDQGGAA